MSDNPVLPPNVPNYHARQAAHLRALAENEKTPRVKLRALAENEKTPRVKNILLNEAQRHEALAAIKDEQP